MNSAVSTVRRDQHELLHLGEIFKALAAIVARDRRAAFDICELGCATGWLAQELSALGRVTGVDPDAARVARARSDYPGVAFEIAELVSYTPQCQYDLVVSCEVIEHLHDKSRYVEALKRITKSGGWILLTTPNKKLKPYWDAADMGEGLYEDWLTTAELRALFADCDIVQHSTFLHEFAYSGFHRWLNARKLLALLARCKVGPLYDGLRLTLRHGLYQVLLCRRAA